MKNLDAVYAEKIAAEYTVKPASKLVALKKLDRRARRTAELFAYIFGIAGALILGTGMSLCMGVIGESLPSAMTVGVLVGLVGIVMAAVNYPIYKRLLAAGKKKYAFEIMELAKEITEEQA